MSRNLDLLRAAYQRVGREGVEVVVDLLDLRLSGWPPPLARGTATTVSRCWRPCYQYDRGVRADLGEPVEAATRSSSTCAPAGVTSTATGPASGGCGSC